jgi:hypothetical protein
MASRVLTLLACFRRQGRRPVQEVTAAAAQELRFTVEGRNPEAPYFMPYFNLTAEDYRGGCLARAGS